MTLVDRFICRREGHIPAVVITKSTVPFTLTGNTCKRCGKIYEPEAEKHASGVGDR